MSNKQNLKVLNRNKILLLIFLIAMVLRIGFNVIRQELIFHKPFFVFNIGTATKSYIPQEHFEKVKHLFIDPNSNYLKFKPFVTKKSIVILSIPEQLKMYLHHSLRSKNDERTTNDAVWYIEAAKGFLAGKGIVTMRTNINSYKDPSFLPKFADRKIINENYYAHKNIPPLYPLFLAICFYLGGGVHTLCYFIPQLIISSLTCLLIYLLAEELFDKKVALLSGFAVAFYPDLIFWTSFAYTETLFIFLLVLGFWLFIKGNSTRNVFMICLSAFVFGLASLTRITMIPFLPMLFIWQIYLFSNKKREGLKIALLMIFIVGIVLFPWAMRNYALFGRFSVMTDEAGILVATIGEQYNHRDVNFNFEAYDSLLLKNLNFIRDNYKVYLESCWRRFIIFWSPFTAEMNHIAKLYKLLSWLVIFPAAFLGMAISRERGGKSARFILIFILYYCLLHTASFMDSGLIYRYPIQPFLCIFAAYTYSELYNKIRIRNYQ